MGQDVLKVGQEVLKVGQEVQKWGRKCKSGEGSLKCLLYSYIKFILKMKIKTKMCKNGAGTLIMCEMFVLWILKVVKSCIL